jgi:hypothetical protein
MGGDASCEKPNDFSYWNALKELNDSQIYKVETEDEKLYT